jgi:hypothetical protein
MARPVPGDRVFPSVAYNIAIDRHDREGLNFGMTPKGRGPADLAADGPGTGVGQTIAAEAETSIGCSFALLRLMIVACGPSSGPRVAPGCPGKCAAGTRDICWIDPGMLRKGEQQRFLRAEVIENPRQKFRLGGSAAKVLRGNARSHQEAFEALWIGG